MPRKLDEKIADKLKEHGFGADACWDCHGTWVIYHKVLERIAAAEAITYETPQVLVAEKDAAVILVTGARGEGSRAEWSIGEATPKNNKNAYPFAMAEKRAKDRVILKLIGLAGFAYSEEEADDFKDARPANQPQQTATKDASTPFDDKPDPVAQWAEKQWTGDNLDVRQMKLPDDKILGGLRNMAAYAPSVDRLNEFWVVNSPYLDWLQSDSPDAYKAALTVADNRRAFLSQEPKKEAA